MSQRRSIYVSVFLLANAVLPLAGCNGGDTPSQKRTRPRPMVTIAAATVVPLADRLALTGSVEPTRVARMASPVEGPVIACPVREGDRVCSGQLLARLGRTKGDDATAASARAELEREKRELSRIEKLVKTGALPGEELEKARVTVSEAEAKLARATERLGDYQIVAPYSGIVSRVLVAVGDFVSARATVIELFDPESLVVRFAVPERKAASIRAGAAMRITLDAHPEGAFTGAVTRVYPEIDRRTHTRIVEGDVKGDVVLVPGMFARLEVTLSSVPDAVAIPREAVLHHDNAGSVIFVVKEGGEVERRLVTTGIEDNGMVHVIEGVKPGEQVAVAGHARLRDGMKVRRAGEGRTVKGKTKRGTGSQPQGRPDAGGSP